MMSGAVLSIATYISKKLSLVWKKTKDPQFLDHSFKAYIQLYFFVN